MGHISFLEVRPLLQRIGTQGELPSLRSPLPDCVREEVLRCAAVLDAEYGAERDYLESGGYILIAESADDLREVRKVIDYGTHPCEWADRLGGEGEYISALYLLNDDFSVVLLLPAAIAPDTIINELED